MVGEGMQTGANDVFEVDGSTIRTQHLERKHLRKHAPNSNIAPYSIQHSGKYLIWVEDCEHFSDCPTNIANYLKRNGNILKKRAAYVRGNCEWYKFTWTLHREWYDNPKIIVPYRAPENRFALDENAEYLALTDTTVIFKRDEDRRDLRYYLALLNSRVLTFRFRRMGKMTGSGMFEYFKNSIAELPIRSLNLDDPQEGRQHDMIVGLVDEMIALKKERTENERLGKPQADALELHVRQIDDHINAIVYDLYDLSPDQIAIVQGD